MIASHDRSGYFGASDTHYVIGNPQTASFRKWWLEKMGFIYNTFENRAMNAGTHFEHKILSHIGVLQMDKQVITEELKLRINLDGNDDSTIYEVKTYNAEKGFKLPRKYINQVVVQMFGTGYRKAYVVAYGLNEEDYKNYFNPIDSERISFYPIEYDEEFIEKVYLPRLKVFAQCLEEGCLPEV